MHDRFCSVPLALLVLGLAAAASAQNFTPGLEEQQKLAELADRIVIRPGDPRLHLEVAEKYFRRGAQGDAARVFRHLRRATLLDPSLDDEVRRMVQANRAGATDRLLSPIEQKVDERIASSLGFMGSLMDGAAGRAGAPEDFKEAIRSGLAERMVRRSFDEPLTSFAKAQEEFARVMDWEGDPERRDIWDRRLQSLGGPAEGPGWIGGWQRQVYRSMQENRGLNLRGRSERQEDVGPFDSEGEPLPDALALKNEAVLAFCEGDMEGAVTGLLAAVAAAETRRCLTVEQGSDPFETRPPVAPIPDGSGVGEGSSGEVSAPTETIPGSPPELSREVGQSALEAIEAMSNPAIESSEVTQQIAETAAVGMIGEPLLLDLDGDGVPGLQAGLWPDGRLHREGSVRFDLDGDGFPERSEWLLPGRDGLLAVDLDGDGVITSGRELFGDAFGDRDGFARLAVFDLDGDGWLRDRELATLLVWVDDGDGRSEAGEIQEILDLGVQAISCHPQEGVGRLLLEDRELTVWDWHPDIRAELVRP